MNRARRTILVVDDDHDFSESLAAFLTAHGFRVVQAFDGANGLTQARLQRPDLILMDVMMNERTEGFFTVQEMRHDPALDPVPIFIVSALYTAVPNFRIAPDRGWLAHDAFFPKPVDLDRLLAEMKSHLATAARSGSPVSAAPAAPAAASASRTGGAEP